jgi:ferredoxin
MRFWASPSIGRQVTLTVGSQASRRWQALGGVDANVLVGEHVAFWLSIGAVVAFLPYFPYSKHIHLFFAPLNFALKPERKSIGELSYINLDDQSIEQFGAAKMKDLGWEQIMDSYACIMCFRCQEVCPAYNTGKVIIARRVGDQQALSLQQRRHDRCADDLIDLRRSRLGLYRCGACVDICPVGNEPMRDILDIRRNLILMESNVPEAIGDRLQRHGAQHEPVECFAGGPHEVGGRHERADH